MYQGKFDSKNKKTSVDVSELVAQRNAAPARKPAPARQQAGASRTSAPASRQAPARTQAPARSQNPARKQPAPQSVPERKGPRLGGVIFYTFYFMFILLFFVATWFGLNWLNGWLVDYEAAQPTTKSQEVFEQLFSDPDWGTLYEYAGIEDTEYEGKAEYVTYMENKVGDTELTFLETSAGLSINTKKYIVKLGDEKIALFTLVGKSEHTTDIPDWQLDTVELYFEREESFLIQIAGDHTAYVNGVALGEDFTIQIATTKAESSGFLPIGVGGAKVYTQQISGLMAPPTVTVVDNKGNDIPVSYDEQTQTYTAQTEANTMSDEQKEVALSAIKAYAEYQIKEASRAKVAQYFDASGEAYQNIMETVLDWTKDNNGYSFANDSVTGYTRYSETLFSVYATTELTIHLLDGGTQVKPINSTLLFELKNGNWKVVRMTNADISEPLGEVRLTFMNDTEVLDSRFVENDADELTTPVVSAPDGKVFVGWIAKVKNDEGQEEWNLVFTPDETGHVTISSGTTLEPMTLYAYFEDASAVAASNDATEGAE